MFATDERRANSWMEISLDRRSTANAGMTKKRWLLGLWTLLALLWLADLLGTPRGDARGRIVPLAGVLISLLAIGRQLRR